MRGAEHRVGDAAGKERHLAAILGELLAHLPSLVNAGRHDDNFLLGPRPSHLRDE